MLLAYSGPWMVSFQDRGRRWLATAPRDTIGDDEVHVKLRTFLYLPHKASRLQTTTKLPQIGASWVRDS